MYRINKFFSFRFCIVQNPGFCAVWVKPNWCDRINYNIQSSYTFCDVFPRFIFSWRNWKNAYLSTDVPVKLITNASFCFRLSAGQQTHKQSIFLSINSYSLNLWCWQSVCQKATHPTRLTKHVCACPRIQRFQVKHDLTHVSVSDSYLRVVQVSKYTLSCLSRIERVWLLFKMKYFHVPR